MLSYSTVNDISYYKELNAVDSNQKQIDKLASQSFKNLNVELARNSFQGTYAYFESLDEGLNYYHSRSDLINIKGFSTVEKLERNPSVHSAITNLKLSVLTPEVIVKPSSKDEKAKELAEFVQFNFDNMESTIKKFLYNTLTAIMNGYSISEKNLTTANYKGENKKVISSLKSKKAGLYGFRLDEFDNILSIIDLQDYTDLPKEKFIYYSFLSKYENPYGFAYFDILYPLYLAVNSLQKQMMLGSSKFSTPSLGLFTPVGLADEEIDAIRDFADNYEAGTVGLLPDTVKAEVLDITGRSSNPYKDLLDYFVSKIEQTLLLNDLTISQSKGGGTRAETSEKIEHGKLPLINYIRRDLEELLKEQLIRPLIAYNYDPEIYPIELYPNVVFNDNAEKDRFKHAEILSELTSQGYLNSDKDLDRKFVLTEIFDESKISQLLDNDKAFTNHNDERSETEKLDDMKENIDVDLQEETENYSEDYIEVSEEEIQLHSNYDNLND